MYTVCPHCNTVFPLAPGRKRRKTAVYCKACDKKFKVTEVLQDHPLGLIAEAKAEIIVKSQSEEKSKSDTKVKIINEADTDQVSGVIGIQHHDESIAQEYATQDIAEERLPWEHEQKPTGQFWLYGSVLGVLLFIIQLINFEWDAWSQNRVYRPYLDGMCRKIGCVMPLYRNLAEFEVNQGGLIANADNTLSFKAVISNHAHYAQPFPKIRLKLSDYNEAVFAERIFTPKDYLQNTDRSDTIPAEETFAVQLQLVKPITPIGGYTFDLVD